MCVCQGVSPGGCQPRGCLSRTGVCPGVSTPACTGLGYTHPAMDRMTDACENITLPQLRLGW